MASGIVDKRVEWEAQRVAAAFGIKEWFSSCANSGVYADCEGDADGIPIKWSIERDTARLDWITVGEETDESRITIVYYGPNDWRWDSEERSGINPTLTQLTANGLYRLGIESEGVSQGLGVTLTSHEEMELRLSMPREFWPKTWKE